MGADLLQFPTPAASGPMARVLERLEKVRKAGRGYTARCPAHADRNSSLSIGEGANEAVLLHCFAGCEPASILGAIGLQLGDLFPERLRAVTPRERAEAARYSRESKWAAAMETLAFEACILEAAAERITSEQRLSEEERARVHKAGETIRSAREVLRGR